MPRTPRVGRYELVRKLATGGMAEVFLAHLEWARGLTKPVVVKRILPHLSTEPDFVEMFFAEAQLAAQLNHPHIVQVIEYGEVDGAGFLAMEHVDGPSLRALLNRLRDDGVPLPVAHAARIAATACEALAYAHDLPDLRSGAPLALVHRDVSLDNLLISKAGAVKLLDFGIAKAAMQAHRTGVGIVKGKLAYMAPEQVRAEPVDRRADIHALGVVLYELLSGARPFDVTNEAQLVHAIVHEDRVPLRARRPDAPPELERIVHRAFERDRARRYPDCRAMHADLEDFLRAWGPPVTAFHLEDLARRCSGGPLVTGDDTRITTPPVTPPGPAPSSAP